MRIIETAIAGVAHIEVEPHTDERGAFARTFCLDELRRAGHPFEIVQANLSSNTKAGTLRGLHYQAAPVPDPKIVRCEAGAVWDVALDLRRESPTYLQWTATELSADNMRAQLIPGGCAHGFISLTDNSRVVYLMGAPYEPDLARGVRWDDPAFGIDWPRPPAVIGDRDASYPDFEPA